MRIARYITALFLIASCHREPKSPVAPYDILETIEIPEKVQFNKNYNLNELFAKVEIIPLETTDESLLRVAKKVLMGEYIYYINYPENLVIFDRAGKFVRKLAQGKGPGEVSQVLDFQIGDDGDLYVLEYKNIVRFSPDGFFKEKYKVTDEKYTYINPNYFGLFDPDNFFVWVQGTPEFSADPKHTYQHLHHIHKGKLAESGFDAFSLTFGNNKFIRSNDRYYLSLSDYDNRVAVISKKKGVEGVLELDFGKYNVNKSQLTYGFRREIGMENFKKLGQYSSGISNFIDLGNYYFFQFVSNSKYQFVFYKKDSRVFFATSHDKAVIEGLLPFRIIGIDYNAGKLLAVLEPSMWFDFLKKAKPELEESNLLNKQAISILSGISDIDNPYLIRLSLN